MENKFYTFFIEQIVNGDGYAEYSSTKGYSDHKSAQVAYFQSLASIANDIGKNHTYAYVEIKDSFGRVYENNMLGQRVMPTHNQEESED